MADNAINALIRGIQQERGIKRKDALRYVGALVGRRPSSVLHWVAGYPIPTHTWMILLAILAERHPDVVDQVGARFDLGGLVA